MQRRIDKKQALQHLMDLLAIEGLSGREGRVAEAIKTRLLAAGCKKAWMRHDQAHRKIGQGYQIGNLIVKIPGVGALRRQPRRLFMGHMDTVPLCRGAVPVRRGGRIVPKGRTALGGDNRTSIGALISLVETLLKGQINRPPLTVLMTVGEEVGLLGARHADPKDLGEPQVGFNIDAGDPANIVIGAIGADRWEVDVHGRSSHAGVHPEHGISASLIASRAIAEVAERGYFGKVRKGNRSGTSNVGVVQGGEATNQVTDHVFVKGESRSHSQAFLKSITNAYRTAFERAARSTRSSDGNRGHIDFRTERDYASFRMSKRSSSVLLSQEAVRNLGMEPRLHISNGGLDANYLNAAGIPTVTLGAGQHSPHTVDEYVDVSEYLKGCELLVEIATLAS